MSDTEQRTELSVIARLAVFVLPILAPLLDLDAIREKPWLLVFILPGWGLLYAIARIGSAVWERVEPRIVDECHHRLLTWFHRTEKAWNEQVVYRFRDFDVKGLATQGPFTLELTQVYVDLRVAARPLHAAPVDPLLEPVAAGAESSSETSLWPALRAHGRLAILGPPGSGKTTLLKHAALTLAGPRSGRKLVDAPEATPILLFLRDLAPHIASEGFTVVEAVQRSAPRGAPVDGPWLRRRLLERRCVVMLDGLDEVSDPCAREQMSRWVEEQVATFPGNRWIVSSRPFGYQTCPLSGFTVLVVQPLRREQIEDFLCQWYLANEIKAAQKDDPGVRMNAEDGAEDLLARLDRTPDLTRLAVNPLLLTLIASVHRFRSSLPGRRVELYNEICDVFLGRRQEARGVPTDLTPAQKKLVLQRLAWHLMAAGKREIEVSEASELIREPLERVRPGDKPEEFLRLVERGSGLLLEREAGTWAFAHKTFQEYLAAVHAHERGLVDELTRRVSEEWWHETIRLYVAQGDASPIIAACLDGDPPTLPSMLLAIQCADEGREVEPNVRRRLLSLVDSELDSQDPQRRRLAAECRLELRLRNLPRVDDRTFADAEPIINAEYQLFVDAEAASGQVRAPDHWPGMNFAEGTAREAVVGVRGVDALAFCDWLTRRDGGDWEYGLPIEGEFLPVSPDMPRQAAPWLISLDGDLALADHRDWPAPEMLPRLERTLSADLERLLELSEEHRQSMGLDISQDEVKALQRLLAWVLGGDLRPILRLIKGAILQWPTTWWWKLLSRLTSFALDAATASAAAIDWLLRPIGWLVDRVLPPGDREVKQRRLMMAARAFGRVSEYITSGTVFFLRPVLWALGPLVRWRFLKRLQEERLKLAEERGGPPAEAQEDLKTLLQPVATSPEMIVQSISDITLLAMLTMLGEFLMADASRPSVTGQWVLETMEDEETPEQVATHCRALLSRSWHLEQGGACVPITDSTWALRVSLLLSWRRAASALIALMVQSKRSGAVTLSDLHQVPVNLWLEAWAIENRVAGKDQPFEGIRIVKERRYAD